MTPRRPDTGPRAQDRRDLQDPQDLQEPLDTAEADDADEDEDTLPTTEESYLDGEQFLHGLIADDDEVVGLDDSAAGGFDAASLLADDDEQEGTALQRWHDVGPAEDAVDPASTLFPDADESGYTRESDALGMDEDLGMDALFSELTGEAHADEDALGSAELLAGLELPKLPPLSDEADDGAALGPHEDEARLAEEVLGRKGVEREKGDPGR